MTTDVYFPLNSPSNASHLNEHHAYGPSSGGVFHNDLGIEIEKSELANYPIRAAVTSFLRLIPGATPPRLVLSPFGATDIRDLYTVAGESELLFVYSNIDITSVANSKAVKDAFLFWQETSKQNKKLKKTLPEIRDHFLLGGFFVLINAGVELGFVADNVAGNPHLGIEIVYIPSGLVKESGWERRKTILNPGTETTCRMDPAAFYGLVASGPSISLDVKLPDEQTPHDLLPKLSKRILLEVRNEYNFPFQGVVKVSSGGVMNQHNLTAADRGTVELASPVAGDYSVSIDNQVLTELPSGPSANAVPQKQLMAPAHWSLQSIFMKKPSHSDNWYANNTSPLLLFTAQNKVTPLTDGENVYKEMTKVIRKMIEVIKKALGDSDKHFLRIAGWWMRDKLELIDNDPKSTFAELSKKVADNGGKVYGLAWKHSRAIAPHYIVNNKSVKRINKLKQGSVRKGFAILDPANVKVASHHQKLLIVSAGSDMAVAFCGGVDLNPNRVDNNFHRINKTPYHDTHAKVEGPAVAELDATFVQRWNSNSKVQPLGSLPKILASASPQTNPGTHFVQVTRTYPFKKPYSFSPGEDGSLKTLRRAIQRARRFIYFEDQYAYPYAQGNLDGSGDTLGILTDLLNALKRIEFLIIVVPDNRTSQIARMYRYRFLRVLENEAKKDNIKAKVLVYTLRHSQPAPSPMSIDEETQSITEFLEDETTELLKDETQSDRNAILAMLKPSPDNKMIFTHSKIWMIDDVYVKIGACNVGRRSLTFDSETDLHIIDGALMHGARRFAVEFRKLVWGEFLNKHIISQKELLEDPSYALQFWENPPKGSYIIPYISSAKGGDKILSQKREKQMQKIWDKLIDPDGRKP